MVDINPLTAYFALNCITYLMIIYLDRISNFYINCSQICCFYYYYLDNLTGYRVKSALLTIKENIYHFGSR